MKAKMETIIAEIELTEEEKKQCGVINNVWPNDGVMRILPLSVIKKLRCAFWEAMNNMEIKIDE